MQRNRNQCALVFAPLGSSSGLRVAACIGHAQARSPCSQLRCARRSQPATRNPQRATEVTSVASCGLRLHVASDTHSASPLSLRCAGCGCALRAPCTKDSWHPLRLACCNCTLCLARPAVLDLGCAMRRAVAPCTGLSQSSTPSCTGCGLRVAGCGGHARPRSAMTAGLRVAGCGLRVAGG